MTMNKNSLQILLIEDDDIDAMSIQRALKNTPLADSLVRAKDGIEALEILRNGKIVSPFVVLLDLNMPRMNGLEFLEQVRKDSQLSHAVIFVLTTSESEKDMVAAYKKNIAGYLVKRSSGLQLEDVRKLLEVYETQIKLLPPLVHG